MHILSLTFSKEFDIRISCIVSPPLGRRSTREGEVVGKVHSFKRMSWFVFLPTTPPSRAPLLPIGGEWDTLSQFLFFIGIMFFEGKSDLLQVVATTSYHKDKISRFYFIIHIIVVEA